ncbi:MAG: DUF5777 family beta-barrel protein [Bacteroidota bacterium]
MRSKFFLAFSLFAFFAYAQEDLLELLEAEQEKDPGYAVATFKSTRVINGHSIETRSGGTLEFIIAHRFGTLNSGSNELWGLDQANIRLGLEYGVTNSFTIGIGRSSRNKIVDTFAKYRLFRQSKSFPLTLTAFGSLARNVDQNAELEGIERNTYTGQLLIARKINSSLSVQIAPTVMQRNRVATPEDANLLIALGLGGRYKVSNRVAIMAEYYPQFSDYSDQFRNAVAFGVDIETGGHVFQLHFTNAVQMNEKGFIGETEENFWDGGIHYGFNIVRVFDLKPGKR